MLKLKFPSISVYIFSAYDDTISVNVLNTMGFAVRVRSAGQKYGPTCHQRNRADVTEFVTLVRLSSLGQHVGVLALAGYKRRKSALTAGPILQLFCERRIIQNPSFHRHIRPVVKRVVGGEEQPCYSHSISTSEVYKK